MFNRGGFPGQRPMGHGPMNQPGMNHPGLNMSGMSMSGMNMSGMGLSPMNQPNLSLSSMNPPNMGLSSMNQPNMGLSSMNQSSMNLSSMNQPNMNLSNMNHPGINHQRMGHPGMGLPNLGLSGMNQPNMNLNRMNPSGMNQGGGGGGGMGFHPEMKSQGFGMRPMDNTGSFGGNADPIGMKGMPIRSPMHTPSDRLMGSQILPQRFASPSGPMHQGQPRMPSQHQEIPSIVNRVLTHTSDRMMGKPKAPLQEPAHLVKEKQWDNLNVFGNVGQEMGMKPIPGGSSLDQVSNPQNRYTNESASSILESFGLSNEDLEELSRYPDDQLTPSNMPGILRDIRLRKMNRTAPMPDQASGRRSGSEGLPSKVIDYGHSSKYQFNDSATPARSYEPPRSEQKPPPAPKETATPSKSKPEKTPDKGMDNKIPTISGSRKPSWPSSKPDRCNNKTLVGEEPKAPVEVSASKVESPVISIKTDAIPDVAAAVQAELQPAGQVVTGVGQAPYQQPPAEAPASGKGGWVQGLSQEETQKMKRLPTPSMMNDYYAASPRIFPHICSLCNVDCRHLKDWIKHQNNSSHIESCRNLRQQYPDWNPQVLSSVRNEGKKDDPTAKKSKSKSVSPRRSRRSGARKSRSRSPRSSGRRSRSRSPRRSRHSPRRSRSPRRGQRSPLHSRSPRRYRRSSHSTSPDKKAVDAAVQSFIESTKLKSGDKAKSAKPSNNGKKPAPKPTNTNVKNKKPASNAPAPKKPGSAAPRPGSTSSSSSSSKKPNSSSSNNSDKKPGSSSAPRKPPSANPAPKKPTPGNSNSKKPFVSTAARKNTPSNSSGKKPPSKPSAGSTKDPFNPLNKFTSKSNSDKIIHVTNLPDSGYTDQDILKIVQPFGKICDILIVRSKNEAFIETNFREAASAAVKFSESTPVMINNQRVTLAMAGQSKKPAKAPEKSVKLKAEPEKAPEKKEVPPKEDKDKKLPEKSKHELEVPPGFIKSYLLDEPPHKQNEKCVVLISNLPEAQYTVEEITNLAKPFGGVNDILIISNHRKAYLELTSRNSVSSMIKYYGVFPKYLSGNLLAISIASRYKDLKDEDLIFADLIEQSSYKITPTIYEKFVYITNLPEKVVKDFEIVRVALRFGKVEHHALFSNKRKAILHLHSPSAVKAMHSFLNQYPCNIGENVIQCSLPSKTKLSEDEYITYIEEDKQSSESNTEKTECETAEAKEPDNKEEKEPTDKESEVEAVPSSPGSQSEMDVDPTEDKGASAPPPTKDDEEMDTSSEQVPDKPSSSEPISSMYSFVATEDDDDDGDDDEEEAAEAPEAPDTSPLCIQTEPEMQPHEPYPVSQPQMSEALDVLVSVESDEEECEEQHPFIIGSKQVPLPVPVIENKVLDTETSADKGPSDSPESEGKDCSKEDCKNAKAEPSPSLKSEDVENNTEGPPTDTVQDPSTDSSTLEETKNPDVMPSEKADRSPAKAEESKPKPSSTSDERSKPSEEKSGHSAPAKGKAILEVPEVSSGSMIRTTKYNAQKGEISVTVTLDSQKSKNVESRRRRSSRERGTSGHESSAPKSNSNRSSPADSSSSHSKSGFSFSQKKSSGKYGSSLPERDSKDVGRQREREARSNNRKDDKRGSSSSRYTRSSRGNNRSPRSKQGEEETFPFNLDEFVTVDEIVEEHVDSTTAEEEKELPDTSRKGKRKENDPVPAVSKKSRVTSTDSHKPSFVTLDEVGDEEENAGTQENLADQTSQSLVTLDEVHAEGGPPASTKGKQMLMTLDEISDDDDAQNASAVQQTSAVPEILTKDQLLTLDEVNEEDEERKTPTEPSKEVETKLLEDAMDAEVNKKEEEEEDKKESETEEQPEVQQEAPDSGDTGDLVEPPLLTLDEVKADEDEMSFADIEHQFLTVDEIGEEEEESEMKAEENEPKPDVESKTSEYKESGVAKAVHTPSVKRGRPRKRPLPESVENKVDPSQPATPDKRKDVTPKKTPGKAKEKTSKGSEQGTADSVEDSAAATTDKPESADEKPATEMPAKKTKLESSPAEKTKLAPFNSSTPVGLEFLVPKTGYFCELCSLFYMDESSKLKHCKSLRHYQAVEKHLAKLEEASAEKSVST